MIGPGCGVAPFIGYIEEREYEMLHKSIKAFIKRIEDQKFGPMELYYGCRYKAKDFIYGKELQSWKEKGAVTELYLAFSREQVCHFLHFSRKRSSTFRTC